MWSHMDGPSAASCRCLAFSPALLNKRHEACVPLSWALPGHAGRQVQHQSEGSVGSAVVLSPRGGCIVGDGFGHTLVDVVFQRQGQLKLLV